MRSAGGITGDDGEIASGFRVPPLCISPLAVPVEFKAAAGQRFYEPLRGQCLDGKENTARILRNPWKFARGLSPPNLRN
jgi:hypothetical protein